MRGVVVGRVGERARMLGSKDGEQIALLLVAAAARGSCAGARATGHGLRGPAIGRVRDARAGGRR
jgi:hypothetical protein